MLKATTWFERYRKRYLWAVRAYDQFLEELAPDMVDALRHNDQVTIAVYGATQVGKTTLILDLLGLNTATTDEVGRVLRGGQPPGKSATAVPVRYSRSLDDSWHIAGKGPLSADMACDMLGALRRKVESGGTSNTVILDIRIPKHFFQESDDVMTGLGMNIIDIPGINSLSAIEREYVSKLADRYVAVADLVLLVGRADSLGFLNERDLIVPALCDWAAQPTRFRIVLTYGFSPDSLRSQFNGLGLTIDQVRDVHVEQMRTHDYGFPDDFHKKLFVLELGDSVIELDRKAPDYVQQILPLCNAFRNDLLKSIASAAGPYARLQGAFQLDRVVKAREVRLTQLLAAQKEMLEKERQQLLRELTALRPELLGTDVEGIKEAILRLEVELAAHKQKIHELLESISKLAVLDFATFFQVELGGATVERVSWLQEQLVRCEMHQREAGSQVASRLESIGLLPYWLIEYVPAVDYQGACLMEVDAHLDSYYFDKYWLSSSNFKDDRAKLLSALERNAKDNGARFSMAISHALKEKNRSMEAELNSMQAQITVLRLTLEKLQRLDREHDSIHRGYADKLNEMQEALGVAEQFSDKLDMAFLDELQRTRQSARVDAVPAQRFYGLLHTRLLLSEIDRMYEGKSF